MFTDHKKITSHGLHSGFTLIEVLVSITVFLLLLGIFTNFVVQSYRLQTYDVEQGEAVRQARNGVEKMVKELREVTYADDGSYGIVPGSALTESITFYSDVDLDQSTERIRYFLENNQLMRGVIEPGSPPLIYDPAAEQVAAVASFVNNGDISLLTYYNDQYPVDVINNPLSSPIDVTEITLLRIELVINVTPTRAPFNFHQVSLAQLRNLKEEF